MLSGNRDVSCATCHSPAAHRGDAPSLAVGTGAIITALSRTLGTGPPVHTAQRAVVFSVGSAVLHVLGRPRNEGSDRAIQHAARLRASSGGITSLLAAQAMIPVTNRVEMRGNAGDRRRFGAVNEIAPIGGHRQIYGDLERRDAARAGDSGVLTEVSSRGYPSATPDSSLGFRARGERHRRLRDADFHEDQFRLRPLSGARGQRAVARRKARRPSLFRPPLRVECHNGPMLGAQSFASVASAAARTGLGQAAPLDGRTRRRVLRSAAEHFSALSFRIAPLRNVELTAPYMHNGAYATLEAVVRHYNNVDSAVKAYDVASCAVARASYHGDATTISALLTSLDGRLQQPLRLTVDEQSRSSALPQVAHRSVRPRFERNRAGRCPERAVDSVVRHGERFSALRPRMC